MVEALLVVSSLSLILNLICSIFLVRTREHNDVQIGQIQQQQNALTREILLRLPPRPYGIDNLGS